MARYTKEELINLEKNIINRYNNNELPFLFHLCGGNEDELIRIFDKIKEGDTKCGDGPVLTYGPAVQNNLLNLIINSAEKNKIPFQRNAASRSTGTDTDAFAYSTGGVASALISLPLRYMHTTVESVAKEDVENVIRLIYESLQKIKKNQDFRYLK